MAFVLDEFPVIEIECWEIGVAFDRGVNDREIKAVRARKRHLVDGLAAQDKYLILARRMIQRLIQTVCDEDARALIVVVSRDNDRSRHDRRRHLFPKIRFR